MHKPGSTRMVGGFAASALGVLAVGLAGVAVGVAIFSPRSAPICAAVLALLSLPLFPNWSAVGRAIVERTPVGLAWLAFGAWATLSLAWTVDPGMAFEKAVALVGLLIIGGMVTQGLGRLSGAPISGLIVAMVVGFWIATVLVGFEIFSDQALKRWFFSTFPDFIPKHGKGFRIVDGEVVRVNANERNRSVGALMLLFWPMLAMAVWRWRSRGTDRRVPLAVVSIAVVAVVVFASRHESSKVALVLSSLAFAAALWSPRWTRIALAVAWVVATLSILPIASGLYGAGAHFNESLPKTARARVILWGVTAEQWRERPITGRGLHATRPLDDAVRDTAEKPPGYVYPLRTGRHAHNLYLQTWFELGAIGALLLAAAGAVSVWATGALPLAAQPYALATFATVASIAAFSWGMWQAWYQCLLVMALWGAVFAGRLRQV